MRRREFIGLLGGAVALRPFGARAQRLSTPVIGYLAVRSPTTDALLVAAFRQGLEDVGYVESQNVKIEHSFVEDRYDQLSSLALELVRRQVTVIFAAGVSAALAAKAATTAIPIVFVSGVDPVQYGLVTGLNRPEANATGVSLFSSTLTAKRLTLLRELVAEPAPIGFLANPNNANSQSEITAFQLAARAIGTQVVALSAGNEREIDATFATMRAQRIGGLLVSADAFFIGQRDQIISRTARYALPAIYNQRDFAIAGGLMSYGARPIDLYRNAGIYAGRILKGERPGDLPVVQPTKFDFVLNLKTAKALGLAVPQILQVAADEVIE